AVVVGQRRRHDGRVHQLLGALELLLLGRDLAAELLRVQRLRQQLRAGRQRDAHALQAGVERGARRLVLGRDRRSGGRRRGGRGRRLGLRRVLVLVRRAAAGDQRE